MYEVERLTVVRNAAKALVAKLRQVEPAIIDAFAFRQLHGHQYKGETFGNELDALMHALEKSA